MCNKWVISDNFTRMHRAIKLLGLAWFRVGKNALVSLLFSSRFILVIAILGPQRDSLQRTNNLLALFSDVSSVNGPVKKLNHEELRFEVWSGAFLGVMRFVYVEIWVTLRPFFLHLSTWCNWKLWWPFFTSVGAWKAKLWEISACCYVQGGGPASLNSV
jgi:hypothetical protein